MKKTPIQAAFQQVMDETGLNMRSWAIKAKLPETRVKAVMQGKSRNPRADTIAALAEAAGVPVSRLVGSGSTKWDPKVGSDLDDETGDLLFFELWRGLDHEVKVASLTLLQTISKVMVKKVS